jgi:parallel beta-helix repeat protein
MIPKFSMRNCGAVRLPALCAFAAAMCLPAAAATLCVVPGGTGTCLPSITSALSAASPGDTINVGAGTYAEHVVITMPISLIGAGRDATIIDASHLPTGIFIDGLDHPMLAHVTIKGFTVKNANFEGILVTNASGVTIYNNHVTNNNRSLNSAAGECPGLPDFETNEGDDCGQGIHLTGVDHSLVADNMIDGNGGGILIADETGPTHNNLITGNVVTNNPNDCGVTLASHAPAPSTAHKGSFGVFDNTISGNEVSYNGSQEPGGSGVGLFAPAPGTKNYGNAVVNNQLIGNGHPGVSIHSHSPGAIIGDFLISGNYISINGADDGDAATAGPTGIDVFGVTPVTGVTISNNTIDGEQVAIAVHTAALVEAHLNNFDDDGTMVVIPGAGGPGTANATENWWGCAGGPGASGCAAAPGAGITYAPWLDRQLLRQ